MVTQGLRIDEKSRKVWVDGKLMPDRLAPNEVMFVKCLASRHEALCSRAETVHTVYKKAYDHTDDERLDAMVGRIRRKIGDKERPHRFLITEHGQGHRLFGYIYEEN